MSEHIISAEEARRLREAATPGPWRVARMDCGDYMSDCIEPDVTGEASRIARPDLRLIAAAPDLARTVEHLHAELAAERDAVLAFLLHMARTAETPQARGLIATIRRAIELRYHRDPLRTPRADGGVSDG